MTREEKLKTYNALLLTDRDCEISEDPAAHLLWEILFEEDEDGENE